MYKLYPHCPSEDFASLVELGRVEATTETLSATYYRDGDRYILLRGDGYWKILGDARTARFYTAYQPKDFRPKAQVDAVVEKMT